MPTRKIAVLINPHSAGGRALRIWPEYQKKLIAKGYEINAYSSRSEADFRLQVRKFAGRFSVIAVCGGDSSLTIAAEELFRARFSGKLLFLPAGSANDIMLDIHEQSAARKQKLQLGELTAGQSKKIFIGQANWGLGVAVNRQVGALLDKRPWLRPFASLCGFLTIVLTHIRRREVVHATIELGSKKITGAFSVVLVTQIRHWASGLRFAPFADWYAPEFTVVTIRRCGLIRLLQIILAARSAAHRNFPEVEFYQTQGVRLFFTTPQPVQIDGDILHDDSGVEHQNIAYMLKKKKSRLVLATL